MPTGMIRALQVRTADRLRASLVVDSLSGLPAIDALSEADQRELCDVGAGRLAAVAIQVSWRLGVAVDEPRILQLQALMVRELARVIYDHVRRSALLRLLRTD